MPTIDDVIAQIRANVRTKAAERNRLAEGLAATARRNPRGVTDPTEIAAVGRMRADKDGLDAELELLDERIRELEGEQARDEAVARLQNEVYPTGVTRGGTTTTLVRVGSEPHTYQRGAEHSFLHDLYRSQLLNDPSAAARLERHGHEIVADGMISTRALTTGGVASFVPPAYLQDEWAELVRAGRPTANLCRAVPLPATGMSVLLPKLSTGTSTAVQSTQNTAVSETDADDTQITASVTTIAGQQTISRQLLERSAPGVDEVILGDLASSYAVSVDAQVVSAFLNQSGINAVTFTSGSPTVALLYPKLADAVQRITSSRFAAPTAWVMHPRRWGWMLSALDSSSRPLVVPTGSGPNNAAALGSGQMAGYADGTVGTLLGLPVVLDANVPTNLGGGANQDAILLARFDDSIILEEDGGMPHLLRFDAPSAASLSVLLVAYGYMAVTAARQPVGIAAINGTGLAAPSF